MAQDLPNKVREKLAEQVAENDSNVSAPQSHPEAKAGVLKMRPKSAHYSVIITTSGPGKTFEFGREDYDYDTLKVATTMPVALKEEAHDRYKLMGGTIHKTHMELDGYPSQIEDDAPGSVNSFDSEFGSFVAKTKFKSLSEPGKYTSTDPINDIVPVKGKVKIGKKNQKDFITEILNPINDESLTGVKATYPRQIEKVLDRYNVNAPDKMYLIGGTPEEEAGTKSVLIQHEYQKHSPGPTTISPAAVGILSTNGQIPGSADGNATALTIKNLKNLGLQLMLKSSGEYFVADDFDNFADVMAQRASSLAPGLARLGLKVPTGKFDIDNIMQEVVPGYSKSRFPELKSEENYSFGNVNNPLAPFDSFDSRSSAAASAILIATITGLFEILAFVFSPSVLQSPIIGSIFNVINNVTLPTRNSYTDCVRAGTKVFFGLGGIGTGYLGSIIGTFTGAMGRFNDEPGYYNVILRNIVKMIVYELFGYLAGSIANTFFDTPTNILGVDINQLTNDSGLEINPNIGLTRDPTNILNSIRRLLQSRLIGFMNILANLGDIALEVKNVNSALGEPGDNGLLKADTSYDDLFDDFDAGTQKIKLAALVCRNNLSAGSSWRIGYVAKEYPLAWGSSTTPSMYILPETIVKGTTAVGAGGKDLTVKLPSELGFKKSITNRLKADDVEKFEDQLEASYMPFYFHDLRTNEIISFHAFLENIADGYDAEYTETSGYGRIGKVYTYKNTNRNVSFSFYVVATNHDDFNMMWWKINKLITLVYPQYTAGRVVEVEGNKFVQPFSQLPAASPLIRLRLGDIFKSNYSNYNLARLFGAGDKFQLEDPTAQISQPNLPESSTVNELIENRTASLRSNIRKGIFPVGGVLTAELDVTGEPSGIQRSPAGNDELLYDEVGDQIKRINLPIGTYELKILSRKLQPREGKIEYYVEVSVTRETTEDFLSSARASRALTNPIEAALSALSKPVLSLPAPPEGEDLIGFSPDGFSLGGIISGDRRPTRRGHRVRNAAIWIPQENIEAAINPLSGDLGAASDAIGGALFAGGMTAEQFFNTENNPVFKSFKSTKGRGLAGFIKSIKFDWNQSTWRVDGLNCRAPQFLKIDVEFAPVHDLSPGIDAHGFNTAPIYRVGDLSEAVNTAVDKDVSEANAKKAAFTTNSRIVVRRPNDNTLLGDIVKDLL